MEGELGMVGVKGEEVESTINKEGVKVEKVKGWIRME